MRALLLTLAAVLCRAQGIPVTDATVVARCGSCHTRNATGMMDRISAQRSTPEGWQDVVKRMVVLHGAQLSPPEARGIVRYLSTAHGLAPEEARPVLHDAERRIRDEFVPDADLRNTCTQCHSLARAQSWRRTVSEWNQFIAAHADRYRFTPNEKATAALAKLTPLESPEWTAWRAAQTTRSPEGRWLITASLAGHGRFVGELQVTAAGDDEFTTTLRFRSIRDGSVLTRTGRGAFYAGYAWRGRSRGSSAPAAADDPGSETREVMWFSPDGQRAEGRWFWGPYQEFGFDIALQRPTEGPTLQLVEPVSLRAGSKNAVLHLEGDHLPSSGFTFGPGITVRETRAATAPGSYDVTVDVSPDAASGLRDITAGAATLPRALTVYDRIDYIQATPDSAMAAFSDRERPRGHYQFEAIGFHRGPDGKLRTADDLPLGPIDATWSLEVFYAPPDADSSHVGRISQTGLFTPAARNPEANFDVWVVAAAKSQPLTGKAYLVVTVPSYVFNGRRYVRDLDRWVDDGPAEGGR